MSLFLTDFNGFEGWLANILPTTRNSDFSERFNCYLNNGFGLNENLEAVKIYGFSRPEYDLKANVWRLHLPYK